MDDLIKSIHDHKLSVQRHIESQLPHSGDIEKGKMTAGNVYSKKKEDIVKSNVKKMIDMDDDPDELKKKKKGKKDYSKMTKDCDEKRDPEGIEKAQMVIEEAERITKGKKDLIGTVRNGKRKVAEGKWVDAKKAKKKIDKKHSDRVTVKEGGKKVSYARKDAKRLGFKEHHFIKEVEGEEVEDGAGIEKAIASEEAHHMLEKGKKMPVGTVSNGRKKVAEGKWVDVKSDGKSSNKTIDPKAHQAAVEIITKYSGTRAGAVNTFIITHDLDVVSLAKKMKTGSVSDRMDLATAVSGKYDSPIAKKVIKEHSNKKEAVKKTTTKKTTSKVTYGSGADGMAKVGDKIKLRTKTGGVDGEVYEISANGKSFKLKDEWGNEDSKLRSVDDYKKAKITRK